MQIWDNISDAIFHFAETKPDAPAVIDGNKTLTYGEFAGLVGAATVYLRDQGIKADDRVGIAMPNSANHLILAFALMRIGAVPAEVAYSQGMPPVDNLVARYNLKAVGVESEADKAAAPLRFVLGPTWQRQLAGTSGDVRDDRGADTNTLITFSSGSTGLPKAALTTHRQRMLRSNAYRTLLAERWSSDNPGTVIIGTTIGNAAFHQFMLSGVLGGSAVALLPRLPRNADLVRAVAGFEDAVCPATPNMCRIFLKAHQGDAPLFPDLRALITIGLPLFAAEKEAVLKRITPNFFEIYGSSGFGIIAGLRPDEMVAKAATVGRPAAHAEVEIVDKSGKPVPAGVMGRLRCRGETMASAFIDVLQADVGYEGIRDGWYYPGDIASKDDDGYIRLLGRASEAIRLNGAEIYPWEIEELILALPGVREAVVVAAPAKDGSGEAAIAFVMKEADAAREAIMTAYRSRLPLEKRPRRVLFVTQLPKLPSGKIDRMSVKAFAVRRAAGAARN